VEPGSSTCPVGHYVGEERSSTGCGPGAMTMVLVLALAFAARRR
jgi:MYXO-CTERM domain-containing protein